MSGAALPFSSELRGIAPSGSCWRSNRNSVAARAVPRSPSASSPVKASYRSRANTSRYEPKYDGSPPASTPAGTDWPHGLASDATIAPGKVLSSLAFSTLADR